MAISSVLILVQNGELKLEQVSVSLVTLKMKVNEKFQMCIDKFKQF